MHEAQMREEARLNAEAERGETQPQPQAMPERAMPAAAPAIAKVDAREALASAGLQMVETRRDRVPAALPEPEAVPLGRPRRERPAVAQSDSAAEELEQIETRK
jgi:hypothetical protein